MDKDEKINNLQKLRENHETNCKAVSIGTKETLKTNGYCILFDIIDSTKRKRDYDFWITHVEIAQEFTKIIMEKIQSEIKNTNQKYVNDIKTFHKSLGDGFLIFIKSPSEFDKDTEYISDEDHRDYTERVSEIILEIIKTEYLAFIDENRRRDNYSKDLEDLEMKIVITYLTNIYCKGLEDGSNKEIEDIFGRGIDFVFRIEKYADVLYSLFQIEII